jgi:ATP-dependent RNA helicase DHX8/PRP22
LLGCAWNGLTCALYWPELSQVQQACCAYAHEQLQVNLIATAEMQVDINEEEPQFLKGHTARSGQEMSPIRIVKNPDGSMQRAALTQGALAKERREMQQQRDRSENEAAQCAAKPWNDPLVRQQAPGFVAGSSARSQQAFGKPEWKEKALGKATTFGFNDTRPIKQQREGLPIFAFRDDIIQGVADNKIIILSAETGSGKTTQVTQYLAESGWTTKVCCTLPMAPALLSPLCTCTTRHPC